MKLTNKLIVPSIKMSYSLIPKKWFSKLQFKSLKIKESLFDKYFNDSSKISMSNMIAFLKSNSNYYKNLQNIKTKSLVFVGSRERSIMVKSAKKIHNELVNSELEILSGYYHGDLSINHAEEYVFIIKKLVKKS